MLRRYLEKRGAAIGGLCLGLILVKLGSFFFTGILLKQTKDSKEQRQNQQSYNGHY